MKQFIKIKFQKSPTDKHCKRCKWYCVYPYQQNDEYRLCECLLFGKQIKQKLRCKKCLDAEFYENDKRYLKYEIFHPHYETCGDCYLQYFYPLDGEYRTCPVFKKPLLFESGHEPQTGYDYEYHYRCQSCRNAVIKEK